MKVTRYRGVEWYGSPTEELKSSEKEYRALIAYAVKNKDRKGWYPAFGFSEEHQVIRQQMKDSGRR